MEKRSLFGCLSVLIFLIASLSFMSASVSVSPVAGTSYSSSVVVNVTYADGVDITSPDHANFYYTADGVTWTQFATATCAGGSCSNTVTLPSGTEGTFTINATIYDGSGGSVSAVTSGTVVFDDVAPVVSFSGVTSVVNGGNYSGMITLQVGVTDRAVNSVYFNITNSAGNQVAFVLASSGSYYSASFDSNSTAEGNHTITVYANDSLNNQNNTQSMSVVFDNTVPTATFSCSPASVAPGGNVTCTCAPSDVLSGVNNASSTSYYTYPGTASSGTYAPVCDIYDYAGNHLHLNASYTVTGNSTNQNNNNNNNNNNTQTPAQTNITQNNLIASIVPGNVSTISNLDSFGIKEIQISVNSEADSVQLNFIKYSSKPSGLSTDLTGHVFEYLEIDTQNLAEHLSNAIVELEVNKTWMTANSLSTDDLSLFTYNTSSNQWDGLTTTYINEDALYYYYTVQLSHFSYFAIGEKELVSSTLSDQTNIQATQQQKDFSWIFILIVSFVVVAIIVVAVLLIKKRNST